MKYISHRDNEDILDENLPAILLSRLQRHKLKGVSLKILEFVEHVWLHSRTTMIVRKLNWNNFGELSFPLGNECQHSVCEFPGNAIRVYKSFSAVVWKAWKESRRRNWGSLKRYQMLCTRYKLNSKISPASSLEGTSSLRFSIQLRINNLLCCICTIWTKL